MVELVNKEEFTATVAALGLWDSKAETVSPDRDTKYARVRTPVGHCTQQLIMWLMQQTFVDSLKLSSVTMFKIQNVLIHHLQCLNTEALKYISDSKSWQQIRICYGTLW